MVTSDRITSLGLTLGLGAAALAGSVLIAPGPAHAQSVFAFEAPIAPEGTIVGRLRDAPLTVIDWIGPHEVRVRYQDAALRIETPIDLARAHASGEPHTQVVIGTGRRSDVDAGPWDVTMEAGAWAPLRGFEGHAWRIALPRRMPVEEGLVRDARPLRGTPRRAFDHRDVSLRGFESACDGQLTIRASAEASSPTWQLPPATWFRITPGEGARATGPMRVEVRSEGFVVRGFVDARPTPCDGMIGLSGMGTQCGDGASRGLVVRVPRGTPLYASSTSTEPFARTRSATIARELLELEPAEACSGDPRVCTRVPAIPTGTQRVLFDRDSARGADWSFVAEVRVPFETLPRVSGHRGFGHCASPPNDWP